MSMNKIGQEYNSLLIAMHLTDRCNLSCKYCYSHKSQTDMLLSIAFQTVDFASSLCKKYNRITLAFSGGEPTIIFKNIKSIVAYAQKKGIKGFIICTNGINLTKEYIEFLLIIMFLLQ